MAVCAHCGETTYRYQVISGHDVCFLCVRNPVRDKLSTCFPFTTVHFNNKPVEVTSLKHYRKLCREHGTFPVAFEMDSRNTNPETMIEMGRHRHERNMADARRGFQEAGREVYRKLTQS